MKPIVANYCSECVKKDKEIKRLKSIISAIEEIVDSLEFDEEVADIQYRINNALLDGEL